MRIKVKANISQIEGFDGVSIEDTLHAVLEDLAVQNGVTIYDLKVKVVPLVEPMENLRPAYTDGEAEVDSMTDEDYSGPEDSTMSSTEYHVRKEAVEFALRTPTVTTPTSVITAAEDYLDFIFTPRG